jgi:nucleolar protein 56
MGFMLFDESFTLIDYELFPKGKLAEKVLELNKGNLTVQEESILKRNTKKCDSIIIETNLTISNYKNLKRTSKFKFETPNSAGEYLRSNMAKILVEIGSLESEENLDEILHNLSMEIINYKLKEASKARDSYLIQAINSIDEIDEATGKLIERLREWHTIHFPELNKIKNQEKYVNLVTEYGDRESIIESGLLDEMDITDQSTGAEIKGLDLEMVKNFAGSIKSLQDTKKFLTDYVEQKMNEIAPNLSDLVGSLLGAKLVAHAGSLERLAMLSSSTVQIIGAEKALFRHLKTGERPPKHGLIYQFPEIRSAKWWLKGKIARALAAKISLAVRKDVYSGEFDADIKPEFEEHLEEIKKKYPFPPRAKKTHKEGKKGKKKMKKKKRDKYRKKIEDYY